MGTSSPVGSALASPVAASSCGVGTNQVEKFVIFSSCGSGDAKMLLHAEGSLSPGTNLYGTLMLLTHLTCKHLSLLEAHSA